MDTSFTNNMLFYHFGGSPPKVNTSPADHTVGAFDICVLDISHRCNPTSASTSSTSYHPAGTTDTNACQNPPLGSKQCTKYQPEQECTAYLYMSYVVFRAITRSWIFAVKERKSCRRIYVKGFGVFSVGNIKCCCWHPQWSCSSGYPCRPSKQIKTFIPVVRQIRRWLQPTCQ